MLNIAAKKILIGITGGIAAYKVLELIRRLKEHGAQVKVVLTESGKEFVTPVSVHALTGEVEHVSAMSHITLARWADIVLIAPATANFIAKFTHGLADDLLSTICLATQAPILLAPAMNQQMWQNIATQSNIAALRARNIAILGPAQGLQACGENGPGRMLEVEELLFALDTQFAAKFLNQKHIVITAGPTQEAIDPVRYISNHSSGKMGYALATAALQLGAKVILISGPTAQTAPVAENLTLINVLSAQNMLDAVMQTINAVKTDVFIACAAVADYTPILSHSQKLKKSSATFTLELQRTPDILATVATLPAAQRPFTIGFAAETENLLENAQQKLRTKCLDLVVANLVAEGKVFNADHNQVLILRADGTVNELPLLQKKELAFKILSEIN